MFSTDRPAERSFAPYRDTLLATARASIRHGLERGEAPDPVLEALPQPLRDHGASFITLQIDRDLRGCIGSLEAYRPLVDDVAANAYAAAFRDPRFAPLNEHEFGRITLHISILHPARALQFDSEAQLLDQLRPGVDGLILEVGNRRGTFLPSVWEALPEPERFLQELKRKAGLAMDFWSDDLRVWCYTTESVDEAV